ncbi:MAG: N-acetylmuramoyl-L-alanine amidase [Bacteroidetes bacterium]|nr:N-acetylmuramoyl-L-alanine amidase [Bacteroidota bacterium]
MIKGIFRIACFLFFPLGLFAQQLTHLESKGDYFHVYSLEIDSGKLTTILLPLSITGMSFQLELDESFEGTYILNGHDRKDIHPNTHDKETKYEGLYLVSELILFDPAISSFQLYTTLSSGKMMLHFYHAGSPAKPQKKKHANADSSDCSKPISIDQSAWRAGLPAPTVLPTYTETDHIVIHHTAGSNSNTDPLSAIRTIYIYHTETNGWDDIGYNYVIARDGSLYDGRDGQGQVEEDFVKGAHFCAKNSNTMGIAIMGTYTDEAPPDTAVETGIRLLSWKLHKDGLNPLDSFIHPRGTTNYLPVICGHRDGCVTECPGEFLFDMFPDIRQEVWQIIQNCPPLSVTEAKTGFSFSLYPQPAMNLIYIQFSDELNQPARVEIHDLNGKLQLDELLDHSNSSMDVGILHSGLFVFSIWRGGHVYRQLMIKL